MTALAHKQELDNDLGFEKFSLDVLSIPIIVVLPL